MSLWGATVITNLLSAIPVFGQDIVELIWGGFSVSNATLNRFFSLHYLLPFLLAALALAHLIAIHVHGFKGPKFLYGIKHFCNITSLPFILPNFKAKNRIGPHNEEIISLLVGSLLGDCHGERLMNGGVRFKFKQSIKHKEYLFFLYEFLLKRGYTNNTLPNLVKNKLGNKTFEAYYFNTYSFSSLLWLYKSFYKNKSKVIPNNIYDLITPLALAIWIQDDGTWKESSIRITTNNFNLKELEWLVLVLNNKFNLKCSIHHFTQTNQYQIYIKKESLILVRNLTLPFFHKSMYYKLGLI